MEPQQTQQNDMTPEEAKASLGIATYLQQQMLPQGVPIDGDKTAEMAPDSDLTLETEEDLTPRIDDLESQFKDFQKEVKKMIKDEIGGIRQDIKDALQEDDADQ